MAEKGFGVKEVNLIGASGTPTITSPNNLNLNANNVAISTNVSIGVTLSVTGNVSVGGTLTYEDVTNIDSVGIITARSVIQAGAGLTVVGVSTFNSDINFGLYGNGAPKITFDDSSDLLWFKKETAGGSTSKIWLGGGGSYDNLQLQQTYTSGGQSEITTTHSHLFLATNSAGKNITLQSSNDIFLTNSSYPGIKVLENGVTNGAALSVEMYWGSTNTPGSTGGKKFETTNAGVVVTGICTATSFSGSGANLTNLPATDPTNSDIQVVYTVTANGASAYRFAGNGVVSTADNPDLYFIRGKKYRFVNNSGGSHPFQIRESSGGTAYSTGVTNNGAASGNIDFAPTFDSPAQLVYQCTVHGGMVGNIYLRGGNGNETNVGVTTFAATGSNPFIQQWRLTSNKSTSSSSSDISANLEVVDSGGYGGTGGTMTESSGVFTFPSTGIYLIMAKGGYSASGGATSNYNEMDLHTTTDGSNFNRAAIGWCYIASGGYGTASCDFVFNVTNTSTHKVKFRGASASSNAYLTANTNDNQTHFTFMRIAAT